MPVRRPGRWTGARYGVEVARLGTMAAVVFGCAALLVGCGGGSTASTTTSTSAGAAATAPFRGTPLAWITTEARPWNGRLNRDQAAVDSASTSTTGEVAAATYFQRLQVACSQMARDASMAQRLPKAPTARLDQAWLAMTAGTEQYAVDCLALARTGSSADLTTWQNSLRSMDAANASLNTVVGAIRTSSEGGG